MEEQKWIVELKERTGYKQVIRGTKEEAIAIFLRWINPDYVRTVTKEDVIVTEAK